MRDDEIFENVTNNTIDNFLYSWYNVQSAYFTKV